MNRQTSLCVQTYRHWPDPVLFVEFLSRTPLTFFFAQNMPLFSATVTFLDFVSRVHTFHSSGSKSDWLERFLMGTLSVCCSMISQAHNQVLTPSTYIHLPAASPDG